MKLWLSKECCEKNLIKFLFKIIYLITFILFIIWALCLGMNPNLDQITLGAAHPRYDNLEFCLAVSLRAEQGTYILFLFFAFLLFFPCQMM